MKKTEKQYQKTKQIFRKQVPISLKSYVIFLALIVTAANLLFFSSSYLAIGWLLLVCVRICCSRQPKLIWCCLFVLLLATTYFGYYRLRIDTLSEASFEERQELSVLIDPNESSVNGDLFQAEGRDQGTGENYQLFYQVKTQQEKKYFEELANFTLITSRVSLEIPRSQRNLNGFDYQAYLKEQHIYRVGRIEQIKSIEHVTVYRPTKLIKLMRRRLTRHIDQHFEKATASYLKSLFLGVKDGRFKRQQQQISRLGILHFFSISGMHVFFLMGSWRYLLTHLGITKEQLYWFEWLFFFTFFFITGSTTSVSRSVTYLALSRTNERYRWHLSQLDCWSVTLIINVVINPYLLSQASGQLSFGLTFFLIYIGKLTKGQKIGFGSKIYYSCCLSVFSVPLVSYHFFEWGLLSIVLTVILMPVFTYLLLPSLSVCLVLSFVWPTSFLYSWLEQALLYFQGALVKLGTVNFLRVVTGAIPLWSYLLCLCLILWWLASLHRKKGLALIVLASLLILPSVVKYTDSRGLLAVIDVGQGDALLIQEPFHQHAILVDTGGSRRGEVASWQTKDWQLSHAEQTVLPFLRSRGLKRLDKVFITHGHEDHFGNLLAINQELQLGEVLFPEGTETQLAFRKVLQELKTEKVPLRPILAPNSWQAGETKLTQLFPFERGHGENDDSLVLDVRIKEQRFLMTGDLEQEGETKLLAQQLQLSSSVLIVGHHGSRTSSTAPFLASVRPQIGIISAGLDNRFGHPHSESLDRLAEAQVAVYRTDLNGMVYFEWSPWSTTMSKVKTIK